MYRLFFRIRRGNGQAGSIAGATYHDLYDDYVFVDPNTQAQQTQRAKLTAAVAAWQALSESAKQVYRDRAAGSRFATGFTLHNSEYIYTH
jgi:hypothetical protein